MARIRRKAKKRERPLGAAIGLGLTATLGVGILILIVQLLLPHSTLRTFFDLSLHASSATLPLDPLYQDLKEGVNKQEALFATPFSLLCGGLVLGRFAPHYAPYRRVLIAGAAMAFGIVAVSLAFAWTDAVYTTRRLAQEGGWVAGLSAPLEYVLRQTLWGLGWIGVCVGGTWLGLRLRDRRIAPPPPILGESERTRKPRPSGSPRIGG